MGICDIKEIQSQINRIEGQAQGIGRMIISNRSCDEVIQQIVAARAALEKLARMILEAEATGCFSGESPSGDRIKRLEKVIDQLFKITS